MIESEGGMEGALGCETLDSFPVCARVRGSYANGCINCASLVTWPNSVCGYVCVRMCSSLNLSEAARKCGDNINLFIHHSNMNGISVILVWGVFAGDWPACFSLLFKFEFFSPLFVALESPIIRHH